MINFRLALLLVVVCLACTSIAEPVGPVRFIIRTILNNTINRITAGTGYNFPIIRRVLAANA